jgi:hypothetical protein
MGNKRRAIIWVGAAFVGSGLSLQGYGFLDSVYWGAVLFYVVPTAFLYDVP